MMGLLGGLFRTVERTFMVAIVILLLATNVLSITSAAFHGTLFDLLSYLPYEELLSNSPTRKKQEIEVENKKLRKQNKELIAQARAHRAKLGKARTVSRRIAIRTAKNVATNVSSVVGKATPYFGAALVVAVTAADVEDGCDTVRDVNEILSILDAEPISKHESEVCGMRVPSADEVLTQIKQDIGGTVYHAKERTSESAHKFYDSLGGTVFHSKERITEGASKFYDALGGTLYEIFD